MEKLTKKAFWQQWPKTAKRFRRAGSGRCLRDGDGCCPIVAVARDLEIPPNDTVFRGTKLGWWAFVDREDWGRKLVIASDGNQGWMFSPWTYFKLARHLPPSE